MSDRESADDSAKQEHAASKGSKANKDNNRNDEHNGSKDLKGNQANNAYRDNKSGKRTAWAKSGQLPLLDLSEHGSPENGSYNKSTRRQPSATIPPKKNHASIDALDALPTNTMVTKGRGSTSNDPSRFLKSQSIPIDDGWSDGAERLNERLLRAQQVEVKPDLTRSLITRNKSPDIPFEHSINPYIGCEHGCLYCFARPTHAFLDLSPGLDFETKLFFKTNIVQRLEEAWARPSYQPKPLALGTNTDPYQPIEKSKKITRQILQLALQHRHPVSIVTKGSLILRDLDLLTALASLNLVQVYISVTTLDKDLKIKLEPRTASPGMRLQMIQQLAAASIPVGAMVAPLIPFVNDHELEDIVAAVAGAGAGRAGYILLRLPLEVAQLFEEWLEVHMPERAERVMKAVQSMRGGKVYESRWFVRMRGTGPMAKLMSQRFALAVKKAGIQPDERNSLRSDLFVPPQLAPRAADTMPTPQLNLFDQGPE